jgi:hypothetical protein
MYINGERAGATALESGLSGEQNIGAVSCYVYKKNG